MTPTDTPLRGQFAVVTGASSGIGLAIAQRLAGCGTNLCLVGRSLDRLEAVAEEIRARGVHVATYQADLGVDRDVRQLQTSVKREWKQLDVLVHSAGTLALGPTATAAIRDFDRQYRINVRAPYLLTQVLLPMLLDGRGQVVFINSSAGLQARAGVGQYAATKQALKAVADSLREEVHSSGMRVLSVFPGRTASPMQAAAHQALDREYRPDQLLQPDDVAAVVVHALTLPATAEVKEINIRPMDG